MNRLQPITQFLRKQLVFILALCAALLSMVFTPPDSGYASYIDTSVLMLLFCLMAVVAGFRSAGVFERMSTWLLRYAKNARILGFLLMLLCFFVSMFVTNDVALITFVPLTLLLYANAAASRDCILTIILQTAAANLGSMMTPIGNPQNLYLYAYYHLEIQDFWVTLLPVGLLSLVLLSASCLLLSKTKMEPQRSNNSTMTAAPARQRIQLAVFTCVFVICLLTVLRIVPHWICLLITCIGILLTNIGLFAKVDYILLLTFVCFFVFVGNIGRIEAVRDVLSTAMAGRELYLSALLSQGISNVPAAVMLAPFTDQARSLLQGVNIGGLGTPIASLASLISYQIYAKAKDATNGTYMKWFLCLNFGLLGILLLCTAWIGS